MHTSRRLFIKQLGMAGLAMPFITRGLMAQSPNSILRHASFGCNGMAASDIRELVGNKALKLVAVADVDLANEPGFKKAHPDVKFYQDWRVLLDKEGKNIDSVNVSTPDHMHAPIAMTAMQMGKHCYCQKPLTHDIYETRRLTEIARKKKLATQMGIQIHSNTEYRMAVQFVQQGVIGKIKEVHTWSSKKWGDSTPKPTRTDPIPETFNWDMWLGIADYRPFIGKGYYHPGNWRKRLDFGTGTFGDMGCHIYDPVFKALALTSPLTVRSEGPTPSDYNWATDAVIHYVFPGTPYTDGSTVKVTWYDGDQRPPKEVQQLLEGDSVPDQGSILIGTGGVMCIPHIAKPQLYPDSKFKDYQFPKLAPINHWWQFVDACRGIGKPSANFDYSGPLTESVLLGGVATRFPKTTLQWNAAKLRFTNESAANNFVRRKYRKGWSIKGLS